MGKGAAAGRAGPDLSNLAACVEDARVAAASGEAGPRDPARFATLRAALTRTGKRLPPLYRTRALEPFLRTLDRIGEAGFRRILAMDPEVRGQALVLFDVAEALLAAGAAPATDAFQEVVSDLYDGFLSAEDRRGVKPPDRGVIAPLVKWGRPAFGPYTLPVDATAPFGLAMGVVSLPPANARRGLLAWGALGHETAGHDVLGADTGLSDELKQAVRAALRAGGATSLAEYWAARIGETASDVMGILNMGPAAAAALVGYFRALNAAWGSGPRLRGEGPATDPHPADVLRGWLAAATLRLLPFSGAAAWARAIEAETDRDAREVVLAGQAVPPALARRSAALVAGTVVGAPLRALEGHALGAIQTWRDADDAVVARLRLALRGKGRLPEEIQAGTYAAHAVAAAVQEALARGGDPARLQGRMVELLAAMHARNASWGPLLVEHPGDLAPHVAWRRAPARRPGRARG